MHRYSLVVLCLCVLSLLTIPAFADVAPAESCQSADIGKPCDNATVDGQSNQHGTCEKDTCTRSTPNGPMSYECVICKASAGKPAGGCNTSGPHSELGLALLVALLWRYRARKQPR